MQIAKALHQLNKFFYQKPSIFNGPTFDQRAQERCFGSVVLRHGFYASKDQSGVSLTQVVVSGTMNPRQPPRQHATKLTRETMELHDTLCSTTKKKKTKIKQNQYLKNQKIHSNGGNCLGHQQFLKIPKILLWYFQS